MSPCRHASQGCRAEVEEESWLLVDAGRAREAGKGMDGWMYALASRVRSLTDHHECSDEGYLHAQNNTTHTNTLQTSYTVAWRVVVGWQNSVRDMCWWLDQAI
jgi:hypothetical protein